MKYAGNRSCRGRGREPGDGAEMLLGTSDNLDDVACEEAWSDGFDEELGLGWLSGKKSEFR